MTDTCYIQSILVNCSVRIDTRGEPRSPLSEILEKLHLGEADSKASQLNSFHLGWGVKPVELKSSKPIFDGLNTLLPGKTNRKYSATDHLINLKLSLSGHTAL